MPARRTRPPREAHSKIQRWTDLIAALLARHAGATFNDLTDDVPAYAEGRSAKQKDTVKRAFERDKDELRAFGIRIETMDAPPEESENTRYRLRPTDFYLPYLALSATERRVGPPGYRSLETLVLSPDDLALIGEAVARLERIGDPVLTEDIRSAANKLAFDLPLFDHVRADVHVLDADRAHDAKVFDVLADALRRRRVVTFRYQKPGDDVSHKRSAEPYGLVFIGAHWYLVARDRGVGMLRTFRISRITNPTTTKSTSKRAEYEIPQSFNLRAHAEAREAWELGDADAIVAEVVFTGRSGAATAAMRAGEAIPGDDARRRYTVRRMDAFARWLLALAGEARPISPPELVDLYRKGVADTLSLYGSAK